MHTAQPEMNDKPALPRVIAVTSGKGGVGKSSISINLGISLAKTGARVCLLDADTGLANANILLGLTPEFSLEHVLYGAKAVEDVMLDGPYGMKIIPGATGISECVSLHPRQQLRLTRELARIEHNYDFLLIDTAAGVADNTLDFICASHHAIIVITPEPTSLTDAFSMIKLLKRRDSGVHFHVVVNMTANAGQAKEVYHRFATAVEKYIGVDSQYLGFILRDESIRASVVLQNPVTMFPDSDPSCRSFKTLAEKLDSITAEIPVDTAFSSYWQQQYAEQHTGPVKQAIVNAVKPDAEPAKSEPQQNDYVAELRSRLLLLIDQQQVPAGNIKALLESAQQAFVERFDQSPVDVLAWVDYAVASPNRDDQLLRDIAERVKSWGQYANGGPAEGLSVRDLSESPADSGPSDDAVSEVKFDIIDDGGAVFPSKCSEPPVTKPDNSGESAPIPAERPRPNQQQRPFTANHGFDGNKFGSQQALLDKLQNSTSSDRSLLDLLYAFQLEPKA